MTLRVFTKKLQEAVANGYGNIEIPKSFEDWYTYSCSQRFSIQQRSGYEYSKNLYPHKSLKDRVKEAKTIDEIILERRASRESEQEVTGSTQSLSR